VTQEHGFAGYHVLALESRRGEDMRRLIRGHGGVPLVVPSLEERPRGPSEELHEFVQRLERRDIAVVIFLTGTGARMLVRAVGDVLSPSAFAEALNQTIVIARGPKPLAALRQLSVSAPQQIASPYTWREILRRLDDDDIAVRDRVVAVQEYGEPTEGLLDGLRQRGAIVLRLLVYEWALPSDIQPLRNAVTAAAAGQIDVMLLTAAVQVKHFFEVAAELGVVDSVRRARERMCVASIGPTTSEALRDHGITPDLESNRPNMGVLVLEAAAATRDIVTQRRLRLDHNDKSVR
jgi:uroporphyrinogen-III synthase